MVSGRIKALSLYKNILRAHDRFLPSSMKQLGDAYVKAEVRDAFIFVSSLSAQVHRCRDIMEIFRNIVLDFKSYVLAYMLSLTSFIFSVIIIISIST